MERRQAAILAADAVGFSRLMEANEEGAYDLLGRRLAVIEAAIAKGGGRVFGSAGDSVIAEFATPLAALNCAVAAQERLAEINAAEPEKMLFRMGLHFGDMILEDGNLFGETVNLAARLESLAPRGGICLSGEMLESVREETQVPFARVGRRRVKNIDKPLEVWCWPAEQAKVLRAKAWKARALASAATLAFLVGGVALLVPFLPEKAPPLPTGPRVAVLPFETLGGDETVDFFSAGLSRDIVSYLSKFSNLFVIDPNAVREMGSATDCRSLRRELDADYILSGSVQRSSDKLRVSTTFTDAATCRQLDSPGPFDSDLSVGDVLEVQLEIAQKVVAQVGSSDAPLFDTEIARRVREKAPETLGAYDCVLLSYWFYENFAPDRHRRALACLKLAVELDPDYSLGWSRLAFGYIEAKKYAIDTPDDWARQARRAADRALDLDPENPDAYYAKAILSQMLGEDRAVFQALAEKAVELNPNDAFVLADLGTWMGYTGEWEKGERWVARAKQLNPKHQSWWDYIWHLHAYLEGDYATARDVALKIGLPNNYMVQASLAATYAMNGEQAKAEETLAHILELRPEFAADPRQPYRTRNMLPELIESIMEGLRRAGLEVPPEDN